MTTSTITTNSGVSTVTQKHSTMFVAGAAFNAAAALMLLFPSFFYPMFQITPIPDPSFATHCAAGLVTVLGIGYYWASQDLPGNASIVRLGALGKAGVVVIAVVDVLLGIISWQSLLVLSGDFVFAVLFYQALLDLGKAKHQ
jgi:hypothetical protein